MITWWLCYGLAMCLQCFGDVLSIFCKYFNDVSPLCLQCSPFVFLYQNQTHRFHPSCDRHALSLLPPTAIVTLAALISQAQQELLASSDISCQSVTCNTYPEGWVVLGSNSPKHCKVITFYNSSGTNETIRKTYISRQRHKKNRMPHHAKTEWKQWTAQYERRNKTLQPCVQHILHDKGSSLLPAMIFLRSLEGAIQMKAPKENKMKAHLKVRRGVKNQKRTKKWKLLKGRKWKGFNH